MDFLKILALLVCLLVASASATMTSHRTVASAAPSSLHKHLHDVKKLKKSAPGCCPSPHVAGTAFGGTCVCVWVCARACASARAHVFHAKQTCVAYQFSRLSWLQIALLPLLHLRHPLAEPGGQALLDVHDGVLELDVVGGRCNLVHRGRLSHPTPRGAPARPHRVHLGVSA